MTLRADLLAWESGLEAAATLCEAIDARDERRRSLLAAVFTSMMKNEMNQDRMHDAYSDII